MIKKWRLEKNFLIDLKDSISLNCFTQSQNPTDNEKNISMAQRAVTHKDQVQSFRMLACKELREHVLKTSCPKSKDSSSDESTTASGGEANEAKLCEKSNGDSERVERLLLKVSTLKKITTSVMEELFFNDAIGNVQIDSIIPSILGSETSDDTACVSETEVKKLKS